MTTIIDMNNLPEDLEALTDGHLCYILQAGRAKLPESKRDFAKSLADNVAKYRRASEKQREWLVKLARLIKDGPEAPAPAQSIGSLAKLNELFDKAAEHIRRPKIHIEFEDDLALRLSVAGETAKVPGSINIVAEETGDWLGRIRADGSLEMSRAGREVGARLPENLRAFAAEPARMAAISGHRTGHCCFCARPLTDSRSVSVGYGPICADRFGLPWGETNGAAA